MKRNPEELVRTLIATHIEYARLNAPEALEILMSFEQDMICLVQDIMADTKSFETHTEEAIDNTRDG